MSTNLPSKSGQNLRLTLTLAEIAQIGTTARENKFEMKGVTILYTDDPVEKLSAFLKAYRLIFNLSTNIPADESVASKLSAFVEECEPLYRQALELSEGCKMAIAFNRQRKRRKVFEFLATHKDTIDSLNDVVFPLGKVTKQYDPSKTQGYY